MRKHRNRGIWDCSMQLSRISVVFFLKKTIKVKRRLTRKGSRNCTDTKVKLESTRYIVLMQFCVAEAPVCLFPAVVKLHGTADTYKGMIYEKYRVEQGVT